MHCTAGMSQQEIFPGSLGSESFLLSLGIHTSKTLEWAIAFQGHTRLITFGHNDTTETDYLLTCPVQGPFSLLPVYFGPYGHQLPSPSFYSSPHTTCVSHAPQGYFPLRALVFMVSSAWNSLPPESRTVFPLMSCRYLLKCPFVSEYFLTT